jgi:N-acyl-D-aspartate/D-glutamate deacylase
MQIIAASSYNAARYLGDTGLDAMQKRGRLQEGMIADITIIDPETVTDNATYAKGTLPTTGIPYVIVNGQMVVKDSRFQKVWAGQPIRFPVEAEGRYEPASAAEWIERHSINTPPIDDSSMGPQSAGAKQATQP